MFKAKGIKIVSREDLSERLRNDFDKYIESVKAEFKDIITKDYGKDCYYLLYSWENPEYTDDGENTYIKRVFGPIFDNEMDTLLKLATISERASGTFMHLERWWDYSNIVPGFAQVFCGFTKEEIDDTKYLERVELYDDEELYIELSEQDEEIISRINLGWLKAGEIDTSRGKENKWLEQDILDTFSVLHFSSKDDKVSLCSLDI